MTFFFSKTEKFLSLTNFCNKLCVSLKETKERRSLLRIPLGGVTNKLLPSSSFGLKNKNPDRRRIFPAKKQKMKTKTRKGAGNGKPTMTEYGSKRYSVVADHDQLPAITISQEVVDAAYGDPGQIRSIMFFCDSDWSRKFELFYQQRIVWVRSNNVLLLRFAYSYEVDLDRIKTERDLLAWTKHLVSKPWMGAERTEVFIEAVSDIKGFNSDL